MALKMTNQLMHLPNDITIDKVLSHDHSYELFLTIPAPAERICPVCGSNSCVIKDSRRSQTVRHIAVSGSGTMLTFTADAISAKTAATASMNSFHGSIHLCTCP